MHKRAIPAVPTSAAEHGRMQFDTAMKENVEVLTGQRGSKLTVLATDATLAQVIAKVNAIIIHRLQDIP